MQLRRHCRERKPSLLLPERESLITLAAELGIADRTFFPGFVFHDGDLPALYRLATVFVSASEVEAQGLVLLEAAACGTPIVTVRAGAAPEIVLDKVNGRLVDPGDIQGMAVRIAEILCDPVGARAMGHAGRSLVQMHSLEKTFRDYEQLYLDLVDAPAAPHPGQADVRSRERPLGRGI